MKILLHDDFNDNSINSSLWDVVTNTANVTVYERNGRLEIEVNGTTSSDWGGIITKDPITIVDYLMIRVKVIPTSGVYKRLTITNVKSITSPDRYYIDVYPDSIVAKKVVGGTHITLKSISYSNDRDIWIAIIYRFGKWFFKYSFDGKHFRELAVPDDTHQWSQIYASMIACYHTATGIGIFDDFQVTVGEVKAKHLGRGIWTWFNINAIKYGDKYYVGAIGGDGTDRPIIIMIVDKNLNVLKTIILRTLLRDDHNTPSLIVYNGQLHVFYSPHASSPLYWDIIDPETGDIVQQGQVPTPDTAITYATPIIIGDKLYLFYRGGTSHYGMEKLMIYDGKSWEGPYTIVAVPHLGSWYRGYMYRRIRDYGDKVLFSWSALRYPSSDYHKVVYFLYLDKNDLKFKKPDGSVSKSLDEIIAGSPLTEDDMDLVYTDPRVEVCEWEWDCGIDDRGRYVVAFFKFIGADTHIPAVAYYDPFEKLWHVKELGITTRSIEEWGGDPGYSPGITVIPYTTKVAVSDFDVKIVDWEVGTVADITRGTGLKNIRPFAVLAERETLLVFSSVGSYWYYGAFYEDEVYALILKTNPAPRKRILTDMVTLKRAAPFS